MKQQILGVIAKAALLASLALAWAASANAQKFSDWSAPVNLGSTINSAANDQHPTLSKDGLTLIFASDRTGSFGDIDLWVSQRESLDSDWQAPQNLTMLNTPFRDFAPNLTPDGHWLFFHSDRPGPTSCGGQDLWAAHRQNKRDDFGGEPPINLGCTLNTAADDAGPTFFEDDTTGTLYLYFTRNLTPTNPDGFDIYVSTCTADLDSCNRQQLWSSATFVPELSSPLRDTRTAIRQRDGLEMIIATRRAGGFGNRDLWVSTRASTLDPWSTPMDLGAPINSSADDSGPALSWDGQTLIFYSTRPGGFGGADLYMSTRQKLTSPE